MGTPQRIAVLGGGISGLSTAYYLSKLLPKSSSITLFEKDHIGGWIRSERHGGHLFELGPRTLRPSGEAGAAVLDMAYQLGLQSEVVTTSKTSPAALNRYIYQNSLLQKLPSSALEILSPFNDKTPALKGLLLSILREPFVRPSTLKDESIHSFVQRRFGKNVADNLISALVHGIYAGNAKELSVKSCMPFLWDAEKRHGSVTRGLMAPPRPADMSTRKYKITDKEVLRFIRDIQSKSSIYTFRKGMQTLTDALRHTLEDSANVQIVRAEVERISKNHTYTVTTKTSSEPTTHDRIISALPAAQLAKILSTTTTSNVIHNGMLNSHLASIRGVDVAVVNMAFRGTHHTVLPINGFGYLIPATEYTTPVLGTVFDSCAVPEQDNGDETRLTVMLGGHKFDAFFGTADNDVSPTACSSATSLHDHVKETAVHAVKHQLGVNVHPEIVNAVVHRQCIPQYRVGHHETLQNLHNELRAGFPGLSVVGASYCGVSVNDCVKVARDVACNVAAGEIVTGLEGAQESA
ncbi:oxygen-dependent protoporphyrinogen oxidase [Gaertneriomyces sp. JEL0708]|nr:oxygen-dependent protoporphyrinogen oxidase [Gaertneriomyces sp. JEL0708]